MQIRTNNGHFWCAEDGGGLEGEVMFPGTPHQRPKGLATADRKKAEAWETFETRVGPDRRVGFRSEGGSWLSAQPDGTLVFNRRRSDDWNPDGWEAFSVVPGMDGGANGGVSFVTDHGTRVRAVNQGGSELRHDPRDSAGIDETFFPSPAIFGGVAPPAPGQAIGYVPPSGLVRMDGWCFADDHGPRPFLIATMMDAETLYDQDLPRLERNTDYLMANGGDAARILSEVDWPGPEANARLVEQSVETVRFMWARGLRTALTVFGSHSHIPRTERSRWVDMLCRGLRDANLAEALFYIEPQNEPGGPRIGPAQLAEEAWIARGYFPHVPIALGAPYSDTASTTTGWEESEHGHAAYRAFCRAPATFCTPHLDRGTHGPDGEYRIARQMWLAMLEGFPFGNNEPAGPDASAQAPGVMQDPNMQRVHANGAWLQRAAFHCWHTDAGVGMRSSKLLEQEPGFQGLSAIRAILPPDVANFSAKNWHWGDNPVETVGGVRDGNPRGPVRTHGLVHGGRRVIHVLGNDHGCELRAREHMRLTRYSWDGTQYAPQEELDVPRDRRFVAPPAPDQVYVGRVA
jgi:hypothetical protein